MADDLFDQLGRLDEGDQRPAAIWGNGLPAEPASPADVTIVEGEPVNGVRGRTDVEDELDPTSDPALLRALQTGDVSDLLTEPPH